MLSDGTSPGGRAACCENGVIFEEKIELVAWFSRAKGLAGVKMRGLKLGVASMNDHFHLLRTVTNQNLSLS